MFYITNAIIKIKCHNGIATGKIILSSGDISDEIPISDDPECLISPKFRDKAIKILGWVITVSGDEFTVYKKRKKHFIHFDRNLNRLDMDKRSEMYDAD